ncbi:hypothetical protein B0T13DRAFT_321419 [Neurospora crassa]|nr:hypothetical protein B0T13DRAFT_194520 [Neurospora crassa]KAK3493892.1 hypothetical protein B0T13DRAFT_321419 [Neurospora crassa]
MPMAFVVLIKRLGQGSWLHFKMQEILEWETGTVEVHQHQGIFFAWKLLLHFIPKLPEWKRMPPIWSLPCHPNGHKQHASHRRKREKATTDHLPLHPRPTGLLTRENGRTLVKGRQVKPSGPPLLSDCFVCSYPRQPRAAIHAVPAVQPVSTGNAKHVSHTFRSFLSLLADLLLPARAWPVDPGRAFVPTRRSISTPPGFRTLSSTPKQVNLLISVMDSPVPGPDPKAQWPPLRKRRPPHTCQGGTRNGFSKGSWILTMAP